MAKKIFLSHIYERGKDYYRKKRVSNIKRDGNIIYGQVRGTVTYNVEVAFDTNGEDVIWMECDCPYAIDGSHCKHEAALYIYSIENRLVVNKQTVSKKTIIDKYNLYSALNYDDYHIYNQLFREVSTRLNNIGIIKTYNKDRVKPVFDIIDEVLSLDFDDEFIVDLMNLIIDRLYVWRENKNYVNDAIECAKKAIQQAKHHDYVDIMLYFARYQKNKKEIMNMIVDFISSSKLKDEYVALLLLNLNEFVEDSDVSHILRKFKKYEHFYAYSFFYLRQLFNDGKEDEAKDFIKKHNITVPETPSFLSLKEKVDYLAKNIEGYKNVAIAYFKDPSNYNNVYYIERLKELCGNSWDKHKFDFFDEIFSPMRVNDQKKIINSLKEYEYAAKEILYDLSLTVFNRYASMIKKENVMMYRYLYLEVLKHDLKFGLLYTPEDLYKCLNDIESTKISKEDMLEIILSLEDVVRFDSAMFDCLEKYLKQKGYDDYVEIIEC